MIARPRPSVPLAAALLCAVPAVARAAPPPVDSFDIRYFLTNEDGNDARQMSSQDLAQFYNRARCECGQDVMVRIQLTTVMGAMLDFGQQLWLYAGNNCPMAQSNPLGQVAACVRLGVFLPRQFLNQYTKMYFEPIWLASGVEDRDVVDIRDATPKFQCDDARFGEGGLWMCAPQGGVCMSGDFFLTPQNNKNSGGGTMPTDPMDMGMTGSKGIGFDLTPPINPPSDFEAQPGDGAVLLRWRLATPDDVSGYRVLCADENGQPVPGKGMSPPDVTAINIGTAYFTKGNLCGGVEFANRDGEEIRREERLSQDLYLVDPEPLEQGTTSTGTTGTTTGTATDGGVTDGATTEGDTEGGSNVDPEEAPAPFQGLPWNMVCSGHVPAQTFKTRIEGLENNRPYQFIVVAYDKAGNPTFPNEIIRATPLPTNDVWEQCQQSGEVCGRSGFCAVAPGETDGETLALTVLALGCRRRRRR